ncbi:hypothetical protein [Anabaena azotica]|uniref:hypothetical protein n=1 Tax=Anabaena azotica TaxID=197653 RepID=UPI0039A5B29F
MADRKKGLGYELRGVGKDSFPHTLKGRGKVTGLRLKIFLFFKPLTFVPQDESQKSDGVGFSSILDSWFIYAALYWYSRVGNTL